MGNRAVVTWSKTLNLREPGIYLHHDGDYNTVRALLEYCRLKEFRKPDEDPYGLARFCQVATNYIGGGLGIGVDICERLDCDNGNNGVYLCKGRDIVSREYACEDEVDYEEILSIMLVINERMPMTEQIDSYKIQHAVSKIQDNDQR